MRRILVFSLLLLLSISTLLAQSKISISGTISTANAEPLTGASVILLNTNRGVVTDAKGAFRFDGLTNGSYTIQVSALGYASVERTINSTTSSIDIQLKDAATQLDAVIVTAQKREEDVQKAPISISAISARQVQQYRLWNSKDLTAIVPNLFSSNSGDDRNVTSIRGIATTSYDPAVATYIDGVNQFGLDTYIAQLLDIERIEVLRGPQGTLYGRNAMGGVINIITKQPSNTTTGFAEVNIGNYGQQRYSAGIRTALIKNKLFLGVSGVYDKRDGYYTNDFNNSSFDKQHVYAGNYDLKYLASNNWSINVNLKHAANRNNGAFPMVNGIDEAFANPYHLNQDATAKMIDNNFNASLTINHGGSKFNFSSQTAFQKNYRYYDNPLDGDFSPIDGVSVLKLKSFGDDWNKVKVYTQEFKFSSPAASTAPFKWTTGVYLFHQNNPSRQGVYYGDDAGLLGVPDTDFTVTSSTKSKNTGFAIYGQGSYAITQKLDLIAGVRFDYEHKKYNILEEYQKDPDPSFETRPDTSASTSFNAFSPKLGLAYKITDNNNLFVSYSRGFRTGGLTQLSSDPSQPPLYPYKPEYSNSVEAGIKNTLLENRLKLNLSLFYTQVANAQVPTLILPDAITITRNAGKLHSKGIELELAAIPVKNLQLEYNFGYTDAKYKDLKLSQNGDAVDLEGKRQIFTPDVTSFLAIQYGIDLLSKGRLKLIGRGEWAYIGKQYFDLSNTIEQSGYGLLNTRIGVACKHAELMFWMRNISDKKYISYAYDFGAIHLGVPKTYGVTLTTRF